MGWSVLEKFAPLLPECKQNAKSMHSDTEVGRCVDRAAGLQCEHAEPWIQNVYGNQVRCIVALGILNNAVG